jgi:hypothetical protein
VGHSKPASGIQVARRPRDLAARSPEVLVSGFRSCKGTRSRRDKRPLKSQFTCASALRHIGCRELENQELGVASCEVVREVRSRSRRRGRMRLELSSGGLARERSSSQIGDSRGL